MMCARAHGIEVRPLNEHVVVRIEQFVQLLSLSSSSSSLSSNYLGIAV